MALGCANVAVWYNGGEDAPYMSRTVDFGCASLVAIFQSFGSMGVRSSFALARVRVVSVALAPCMRADAAETRDGAELASTALALRR